MESASISDVYPIEIRHSLSALQDILNTRVYEKSIDHNTYIHVNGLIASAKFDQEFVQFRISIYMGSQSQR